MIDVRLAIFDFDGTIYKKETFPLMMGQLKNHPTLTVYSKFYRSILPIYVAYKLKLYPEAKMKAQMMERYLHALHQLGKNELTIFFTEMADKMHDDYNLEVVKRLRQHHEDGFLVMIVSGAYTPLLEATSKNLPVDEIIGTVIPFSDGKIDLQTRIQHIQSDQKKLSIHHSLQNKKVDWDNSYAYGDSFSDLPVLEMVGNPIAVAPDHKLELIANEHHWEIIR